MRQPGIAATSATIAPARTLADGYEAPAIVRCRHGGALRRDGRQDQCDRDVNEQRCSRRISANPGKETGRRSYLFRE